MAGKAEIEAIGNLDGVVEATLCDLNGAVLASSSAYPELGPAALRLNQALLGTQATMAALGAPASITIEGEQGALYLVQLPDALLIVSSAPDTNLGVLRLEIRQALQAS